ncbi:polysaccharide biosynthesis tyrosine autokinase [Halomonas sp. HAL1]|uniref:polysaccharide biosynthesis tyrosine autokinase n=1 Tax=Halomonas sp. HAL1 TaxID=550984 RepID=UPI00022D2A0F|nr:polysaccharide biosynthesis tyrosine autokinase [Halomonas sp. HAL1]EHA14317.1 capsular exopolysaccharide family protein [Halomonas sp. HAL1]WKV92423.1 polysaccharide biosynthesis tyrosine autokinase [Halomonas sp. HAL1]
MSDVTPLNGASHQDDEIDLGRLLGLLLDRKWWIIAITVLFASFGVIYALLATPVYQGNALVQIEQRSSLNPFGELSEVLGQTSESSTSAEVQILQSRMVLGQVVDRVALDTVVTPRTLPIIGEFIQRRGIERPSFMQNSAAVWGGESVNVGRLEVDDAYRGQAFTLKAESSTEGQVEEYSFWLEGERLGTGQVGVLNSFLGGEVKVSVVDMAAAAGAEFTLTKLQRSVAVQRLKSRLSVSEEGGGRSSSTGMLRLTLTGGDVQEIKRSLDAVTEIFLTQNVERQSAEAEQSLAFLEEQSPELREQLNAAENRLNEYRVNAESVDLNTESQAAIERYIALEQSLNELEFQEAELAQRFTPSHPSYQALLRQKRNLKNDLDALNERVSQLPETQQEIVRLTRDVEVTQAIYVNVLNKTQELQMARAGTVGNVRIIDDALVSKNAIAPKKPLIVVMATLLGGMLAVGVVLVIGLLRRGIESPEQIEQSGLPVYASVPLSEAQNKLVRWIKKKGKKRGFKMVSGVLAEHAPGDIAIESLRGLRTSLHFATLEATNRCLMITGASPEVGKSFISINLGAVCAQIGQRVLVMDADMRKGHLHYAFGGESANGLSDVLSGRSTWQAQLRSSQIEGLSYMARGMAPPNPSELLMGSRFKQMLDEMQEHYDLIIIDTPPVLAVTDPVIVGNHCGTTLLVARYEMNTPKEMQLATRRLESAGVIVKGAILNAVERKAATDYGYGYYHYSYKSVEQ